MGMWLGGLGGVLKGKFIHGVQLGHPRIVLKGGWVSKEQLGGFQETPQK